MPPRRDPGGDPPLVILRDALSAPGMVENVHCLLVYGSQVYGHGGGDYDVDLILRTHRDGDLAPIAAALARARAATDVCIDFEVYLLDALRLDGDLATADQGCYFLYAWAFAVPVLGSTRDLEEAAERLPAAALDRALERKLASYFCRLRHLLVQATPPDPRRFTRLIARALHHAHLRLGTWSYDEIFGRSCRELIQRELEHPRVCPGGQLEALSRVAAGELDPDRAWALVNRLEARARELVAACAPFGA